MVAHYKQVIDRLIVDTRFDNPVVLVVEYNKTEFCADKNPVMTECHIENATAQSEGSVFNLWHIHSATVVVEQVDISIIISDKEIFVLLIICDFTNPCTLGELVENIIGIAFVVVIRQRKQSRTRQQICPFGSFYNLRKIITDSR